MKKLREDLSVWAIMRSRLFWYIAYIARCSGSFPMILRTSSVSTS